MSLGSASVTGRSRPSQTAGPGIISFEKVPFAVESSGAWGRIAKDLWKQLKRYAKKVKHPNYVQSQQPHTWTAFTFGTFYVQVISFAVAKLTAQAVLRGLKSARC